MPHKPHVASSFGSLNPISEDRRRAPREDRESPATSSDDRLPWYDRHWQKIAWVIAGGFAVLTFATKSLGLHVAGPSDALSAQARADTSRDLRITALERRADRFDVALTLQSYMLCVNNQTSDGIVLEKCRSIITDMQKRGAP